MEELRNEELEIVENEDLNEETNAEGGKGLGVVLIGGALAIAGLAVAGVKAYKKKKADQPKKPKTKLRLVRVPVDEDPEEVQEDIVEDTDEE